MIEKSSGVDVIEIITATGAIQVRRATRITEDGNLLASAIDRHVVSPGDDISGEEDIVQRIAKAIW